MKIKELFSSSKKWGIGSTDRTSFNESFLIESPEDTGEFPTYDGLVDIISDMKNFFKPILLPVEIYKIETSEQLFYWGGKRWKSNNWICFRKTSI
jgi:hypothetical protein